MTFAQLLADHWWSFWWLIVIVMVLRIVHAQAAAEAKS